jgi:hypothetical protein
MTGKTIRFDLTKLWTSKMAVSRVRFGLSLLTLTLAWLASVAARPGGNPADVVKKGALGKRALFLGPEDRKQGIHDGNKIYTLFFNNGGIGNYQIDRLQSGVYPKGSGHSYFADFTPVVGAEVVDTTGQTVHIFSDGMPVAVIADLAPDGHQYGFEPLPGYANPFLNKIAMSDNRETWPKSWPDKDASWDGFWNGQYGKYARADQESYFRMNDYFNDEFAFFPDPADSSKRGLGVEVEVRGYQWAHPAAEDILIWTYWITNTGKVNYDKMVFGMYGDADVGGGWPFSNEQSDDDAFFDKENDIVYQWDFDNFSTEWQGVPAYFGWKFLESPGNPNDGIDNDEDGMVDESQDDGIDNDGDWNPEVDDVGSDGLAADDPEYPGPDADGTEGNGQPDPGEPNFEFTDNDESDQIGLTSFNSAVWPVIDLANDEDLWNRTVPDNFGLITRNADLTFLYGSGYFPLQSGERRKFAIAMLFGEDFDDILRNAVTMQKIYDADYNFARPPKRPQVTAVPGDGKVTLYWDNRAELSRDPIYGYDFEGYAIYRSTDPAFSDANVITDTYGNKTFFKPIAQFDKKNGLYGPHPVAFNGIQFNLGKDTGLVYNYTDTTVQNGQTYYYAVTAYDAGYAEDFYERGITALSGLQPIAPAESPKIIKTDALGNVIETDINTVVVTPNAPAAGYVPPADLSTEEQTVVQLQGYGTGSITVDAIDPLKVQDGWEYHVVFDRDEADRKVFSVENLQPITVVIVGDTVWVPVGYRHLVPGSVEVRDRATGAVYPESDYDMDYEHGNLRIRPGGGMRQFAEYEVSFRYFPVYQSPYLGGEDKNPYFDGLRIRVEEDPLQLDLENSTWIAGKTNYTYRVRLFLSGQLYPADYEIRFEGPLGSQVRQDAIFGNWAPFVVWNVTENRESRFVIPPKIRNDIWDPGEPIIILSDTVGTQANYEVTLDRPDPFVLDTVGVEIDSTVIDTVISGQPTQIVTYDTTYTVDTTYVEIIDPAAGDVFLVHTTKPFSLDDRFSFVTRAARVDSAQARAQLDRIAVVPNPYVVTASWEPQHLLSTGRGQRKIDFIHLPPKATIKIFNMRGYLVAELEHDSPIDDGTESWDLVSKDGLDIAYGVYLYYINAPGIGEKTGKFAVIK